MFLCDEEMNGNMRNRIVAYQKGITYFIIKTVSLLLMHNTCTCITFCNVMYTFCKDVVTANNSS